MDSEASPTPDEAYAFETHGFLVLPDFRICRISGRDPESHGFSASGSASRT